MFYKKGWVPLKQVYFVVSYAAAKPKSKNIEEPWVLNIDQPGPETKAALELILSIKNVGILSVTGAIIPATDELLCGIDRGFEVRKVDVGRDAPLEIGQRPKNWHVDLSHGTVGTGKVSNPKRYKRGEMYAQLRLQYGPFLGCHILLNEEEVAAKVKRHFGYEWKSLVELSSNINFDTLFEPVRRVAQARPGRRDKLEDWMKQEIKKWFKDEYPTGPARGHLPRIVKDYQDRALQQWGRVVSDTTILRALGRKK